MTLVGALTSEIDGLLARFQMTEEEAAELLREALFMAVYQWDQTRSRDRWLLTVVRRGCLRRLRLRARSH